MHAFVEKTKDSLTTSFEVRQHQAKPINIEIK